MCEERDILWKIAVCLKMLNTKTNIDHERKSYENKTFTD